MSYPILDDGPLMNIPERNVDTSKLNRNAILKAYALESKIYSGPHSDDLVIKLKDSPEKVLKDLNSAEEYLLYGLLSEIEKSNNLKSSYILGECDPKDLLESKTLQNFFSRLLRGYSESDAEATYFMMSAKVMESVPFGTHSEEFLRFSIRQHNPNEPPLLLTLYWHAAIGMDPEDAYFKEHQKPDLSKFLEGEVGSTEKGGIDIPADEKKFFTYLKRINEDFRDIGYPMNLGALNFLKPFLYNLFDLRGERRLTALENMLNLRYPFGDKDQKEWRSIIATDYK